MRCRGLNLALRPHAGALPAWRGRVDARCTGATRRAAGALPRGGRLVALWGATRGRDGGCAVHAAAYARRRRARLAGPALPRRRAELSRISRPSSPRPRGCSAPWPICSGMRADGRRRPRPWLRHGAWPASTFPLLDDFAPRAAAEQRQPTTMPFVRVEGDGVHEIPVGPVHAGTIEPGHFRFSVVGENVLRLEERLGYVHKGIEQRFTELPLARGARLAGRVSGDSAVAFAWAYCQALEGWRACSPAARALAARALLERERIANHLGDLGALGNDAGFAFGLSQFSRLKEDLLRARRTRFGHRYLMDAIVPGGMRVDLDARTPRATLAPVRATLAREVRALRDDLRRARRVQDRFIGAGTVTPELAARLGLDRPRRPRERPGVRPARRPCRADRTTSSACEGRGTTRATSRRASPCASTSCPNRCAWSGTILDALPAGAHIASVSPPADGRRRHRLDRGLARPRARRARSRRRRARSAAAIRTIRRGRTGRCSSTR